MDNPLLNRPGENLDEVLRNTGAYKSYIACLHLFPSTNNILDTVSCLYLVEHLVKTGKKKTKNRCVGDRKKDTQSLKMKAPFNYVVRVY